MKDIRIANITYRNTDSALKGTTPLYHNIYCGRSRSLNSGPFGNPFIIGKDGNRDQVCDQFEEYLNTRTDDHPLIRELQKLYELIKETDNTVVLRCYCSPKRCHAESIKKWLLKKDEIYMGTGSYNETSKEIQRLKALSSQIDQELEELSS